MTWWSLCCPSCVATVAAEKSSDKAEDAADTQYKWLRKAAHIRSTQEVNSRAGGGGGEHNNPALMQKARWRHGRLGRKKLYCLARFRFATMTDCRWKSPEQTLQWSLWKKQKTSANNSTQISLDFHLNYQWASWPNWERASAAGSRGKKYFYLEMEKEEEIFINQSRGNKNSYCKITTQREVKY